MPMQHLRALTPQAEVELPDSSGGISQLACPVTLQRYADGKMVFKEDSIAVESDIRVLVSGYPEAVLCRTPGDDMNLVAGHLFSRSMISRPEDMANIAFSYHGLAKVEVKLQAANCIRRIFPSPKPIHVAPEKLIEFKSVFERRQNLYKNTRSTHAAALFSLSGELLSFGEDVGRHNAFDKAIGRALLEGTLDDVAIAMLSSRLALELAVKASTANIPILCGFSAATSSGINFAERNNLTLIGRLRSDSFNVYANGWRIRA
ncbi:formate dehydrogenase accessory sulfurtransferase FdhD [Pseudodesulfovibrio sp. zrk46]|uniref:formate dehydrogenase accessory sulfurtransferase FdhD n=1 Tax=Pseudodesulfovibrio sp. zrk46 TaxID=2725288 RepID=UPI001448EC0C|nr:formate dehydrogenase accessory sulfurtransferase FdhD [Pseudodesulfovibrio sp. zrk46]QJB57198.1 formate dehydrogenase accessory sulfurtransferase FdhD [Pseudodesulfovibrio sp. zrk46]